MLLHEKKQAKTKLISRSTIIGQSSPKWNTKSSSQCYRTASDSRLAREIGARIGHLQHRTWLIFKNILADNKNMFSQNKHSTITLSQNFIIDPKNYKKIFILILNGKN